AFGEKARSSGWVGRGKRLLEECDRDCVERGYLRLVEARQHLDAKASRSWTRQWSLPQPMVTGIIYCNVLQGYQRVYALALDVARDDSWRHSAFSPVYLAGRSTGHVPFRIDRPLTRRFLVPLVLRGIFHRLLTLDTPLGRKARPKIVSQGGPLIRV